MIKSIGALFIAQDTGRILLALRSSKQSHPLEFSLFGGKVNNDETLIEGLERELREELGQLPLIIKTLPIDVYKSKDKNFEYYSMLIITPKEFIPTLNSENSGYVWVLPGEWPKMFHPGVKSMLFNHSFIRQIKRIINSQK
jgi:8-oxo-dGTP pyrophosphatase MutT (NUDIX family)